MQDLLCLQVAPPVLHPEILAGRIIDPCPENAILGLQINHMGVIPMSHTTGEWRLITDLSFLPGRNVNNGIDSELCSLQYTGARCLPS